MAEIPPMPEPSTTEQLALLIDRIRAGDTDARNEILSHVDARMRELTHRMLRRFPDVHRFEQTDDIHQRAMLRLHQALSSVVLVDLAQFFRLSSMQIRRVSPTWAERYRGGVPWATGLSDGSEDAVAAEFDADPRTGPDELARWSEFHEAVDSLDPKLRDVVDLLFVRG